MHTCQEFATPAIFQVSQLKSAMLCHICLSSSEIVRFVVAMDILLCS